MAITNTGLTPGLSKDTIFGFQLQTVEGTQASNAIKWCPVDGTVDFRRRANRTFHRQADDVDSEHMTYSAGQWAQGGFGFILQPSLTVLTDMLSWIIDRDDYNQGLLASVYKVSRWGATYRRECWIDAKIEEARFSFEKGRPLGLSLSMVARKPGTYAGTPSGVATGAPLLWKETYAQVSVGGEALAVTHDLERAEVTINNDVESPAEGLRLCYDDDGGKYPLHIYNKGGMIVSGSLTRDFVDNTYGTAFISQAGDDFGTTYDGQLKFTCARGGHGFALHCHRVQWMDGADGPDYPGNNDTRLSLGVDWHALSTDDGATDPLTYTVT